MVSEFFSSIAATFSGDDRFSSVCDRDPGMQAEEPSGPETWLAVHEKTWVRLKPHPEKQAILVALATRDRNVSEAIEGNALHLGDTFQELLEDGLEDAGEEDVYDVEHHHDIGVFYFESELPLGGGWSDLESDEVREKVRRLALGYLLGFGRFFIEEK
ncbi:MAG: hypothetical protein ACE5JS_15145 [Nitrospinota bacterium]